jgi:hypothetical protein
VTFAFPGSIPSPDNAFVLPAWHEGHQKRKRKRLERSTHAYSTGSADHGEDQSEDDENDHSEYYDRKV